MTHTFNSVAIFAYDDMDDLGSGTLIYFNCVFAFPSMKKYDHMDCEYTIEGRLTIVDPHTNAAVWVGDLVEIPEFVDMINKVARLMRRPKV